MTLSIEQKTLAEERIKAAGLEGRIRVHLLDYRAIPAEFEKAFDAFISIEMIEVGTSHPLDSLSLLTELTIISNSTSGPNTTTPTSSLSTLHSNQGMLQLSSLHQPSRSPGIPAISEYILSSH